MPRKRFTTEQIINKLREAEVVEAAGIEPSAHENTELTTCGQSGSKSGQTCPNCGQHLMIRNRADAKERSTPVKE